MDADKYFYKTIIRIAAEQGHGIKSLAKICGRTPMVISRNLKRIDGKGLSAWDCYLLQQELVPHLTLDELFPESREEALRRISNLRSPSQRG